MNTLEKLTAERDHLRFANAAIVKAAINVIDRWESPLWKDQPATAQFIHALRKSIEQTWEDEDT